MIFSQLLTALPNYTVYNGAESALPQLTIKTITSDSRQVESGTLFVAYQGVSLDSHRFIPQAIERGAAAIIAEKPPTAIPAQSPLSWGRSPTAPDEDSWGQSPTSWGWSPTVPPVPLILVPDGREALAHLSAAWYGFPARDLTMIGITGTDGKTTTTHFLYHILQAAQTKVRPHQKVSMINTVSAVIGDETMVTGLHTTTPDSPDVQRFLRQMVEAGTEYCLLEATSHGLTHHRVTACDFDVAIVSNITHEHLDVHGSLEGYRAAKASLFESLATAADKGRPKVAVLNCDDWSFDYLKAKLAPSQTAWLGYSVQDHPEATITAENISYQADKTRFTVRYKTLGPVSDLLGPVSDLLGPVSDPLGPVSDLLGPVSDPLGLVSDPLGPVSDPLGPVSDPLGPVSDRAKLTLAIESNLIGDYNVSNCLAAITAAWAVFGLPMEAIQHGVAALQGIPGRMERLDEGQPYLAIVDFAHTPNALRRSLTVAQTLTSGRVIAVFGCAGLRDVEKREMMGHIAAELADITLITAEDPRTENLDDIIAVTAKTMLADGASEGQSFERVPDRGRAIYRATQLAGPDDVVITLGKGHEQSMCFGEIEYPWDDREALQTALRGGPLLTLPTA